MRPATFARPAGGKLPNVIYSRRSSRPARDPTVSVLDIEPFDRRPRDTMRPLLLAWVAGVSRKGMVERRTINVLGMGRQMPPNRRRQIGIDAVRHGLARNDAFELLSAPNIDLLDISQCRITGHRVGRGPAMRRRQIGVCRRGRSVGTRTRSAGLREERFSMAPASPRLNDHGALARFFRAAGSQAAFRQRLSWSTTLA